MVMWGKHLLLSDMRQHVLMSYLVEASRDLVPHERTNLAAKYNFSVGYIVP